MIDEFKGLKVGDLIYCHLDGFMTDCDEQFCTKHSWYEVKELKKEEYVVHLGIDGGSYGISDDRRKDGYHSFSILELKEKKCKWFSYGGRYLMVEKKMPNA